jgi:hypothetical protein
METEAITLEQHPFATHRSCQATGEHASEQSNAWMDGGCGSVWDHVTDALLNGYRSDAAGEACHAQPASRGAACASSSHVQVQVQVIERLSDTSISVLWQDATRCRYVDQGWSRCRARVKGRCALSGATIRRDEPVYKPRVRTAIPANASAMILARVLEC